MVEIQETIERLSRGFVAADIMKPNDELICGTSVDHAKRLLEEHKQYDIIPNLMTTDINDYSLTR